MALVWNFRKDDDFIPAQTELEASQAKRKAESAADYLQRWVRGAAPGRNTVRRIAGRTV